MSAITPQTELRLIKCPIESDNRNQLTFSSASAQRSYFNSLPHLTVDNFTYQRKDSVIRYPAHIDSIIGYNYVMYQNEAYTNKWFYAFITNMEYVNDNMTYITIKTDVYQTWQFTMVWKKSFIEREHVSNDEIGVHTVPENLELGEYVCEGQINSNPGNSHLVIAATYDVFAKKDAGGYINGIYNGVDYFLIASSTLDPRDPSDAGSIRYFLSAYAGANKSDAITGLFIVPDKITNYTDVNAYKWDYMYKQGGGALVQYPYVNLSSLKHGTSGWFEPANFGDLSFAKPYSSFGTYVPKNNKMYTYPFKYLRATNNSGGSAIYQYEYFTEENIRFRTKGSLTPGCSIKTYPLFYKGVNNFYDEGLNFGKYPICSYSTDMYTNWLTQNSVNQTFKMISGIGSIAVGGAMLLTGAGATVGVGAIVGGAATIANTMKEQYEHSLVPPQAEGNLNSGDINYSLGINQIIFYKMCIKPEMAKKIDDYLTMYGYKINRLDIPHITGRRNWNYVKTIGANIEGDIPENDMNELKAMFDNGVTLWHNGSTYLDYSQNNDIV